MAEQKLLRKVDLGGVTAISTLYSPKMDTSAWVHATWTWQLQEESKQVIPVLESWTSRLRKYRVDFQANCIDSTAEPEAVFSGEVEKLKQEKVKPREQVTLEPYERDHAVVVGQYR